MTNIKRFRCMQTWSGEPNDEDDNNYAPMVFWKGADYNLEVEECHIGRTLSIIMGDEQWFCSLLTFQCKFKEIITCKHEQESK